MSGAVNGFKCSNCKVQLLLHKKRRCPFCGGELIQTGFRLLPVPGVSKNLKKTSRKRTDNRYRKDR